MKCACTTCQKTFPRGFGAQQSNRVTVHICLVVMVDQTPDRNGVIVCIVWTLAAPEARLQRVCQRVCPEDEQGFVATHHIGRFAYVQWHGGSLRPLIPVHHLGHRSIGYVSREGFLVGAFVPVLAETEHVEESTLVPAAMRRILGFSFCLYR
ncbi:hypothetical protein HPB50_022973 [Hyalomma asiaticum]|uniref:Uncharacterized protein n=1 Tax=Hyalomma asiaticum TaxID=266040 RepID=A0ACB7TPM3_HYAAI|nr:hypothetical protein HPB50_022973 [Hyalomma asiaticum]